MIAVSTLQAMSLGMTPLPVSPRVGERFRGEVLFCPMIDARRMEVYCAIYDDQGRPVEDIRAEIIDGESFSDLLEKNRIIFGGDGAEKCKPALESHPNAIFLNDFRASAQYMNPLTTAKFNQKQFENMAYFEPFYLKDFIAGKPRVKGLH